MDEDIYTCPNHIKTGGYEGCCDCGGWEDGEEERMCTEYENRQSTNK